MQGTTCRAKKVIKVTGLHRGKEVKEGHIRTFLWDNPEIREAFRTAKDRAPR